MSSVYSCVVGHGPYGRVWCKVNRISEIALEVTLGVAVGLYTGNGVSRKINRVAQALERIAADLDIMVKR